MIEFRRKFENRGIKIARVNLILITKSSNFQLFTLICMVLRSVMIEGDSCAQSIYWEVNVKSYIFIIN